MVSRNEQNKPDSRQTSRTRDNVDSRHGRRPRESDEWSASDATTIVADEDDDNKDEAPAPAVPKYQPPARLLLFELTAFILLIILLLGEPSGGSLAAISNNGKGGVGFLSRSNHITDSSSPHMDFVALWSYQRWKRV